MVENGLQNEVLRGVFFDDFRGLDAKVPQRGPREAPRVVKVSLQGPKWSQKVMKTDSKLDQKGYQTASSNKKKQNRKGFQQSFSMHT